jgi:hypothetical protein
VRLKQKGIKPRIGTAVGRIAILLDEPGGLAVNLANRTALPRRVTRPMIADFAAFRKRRNVPALIFVLAFAAATQSAISRDR